MYTHVNEQAGDWKSFLWFFLGKKERIFVPNWFFSPPHTHSLTTSRLSFLILFQEGGSMSCVTASNVGERKVSSFIVAYLTWQYVAVSRLRKKVNQKHLNYRNFIHEHLPIKFRKGVECLGTRIRWCSSPSFPLKRFLLRIFRQMPPSVPFFLYLSFISFIDCNFQNINHSGRVESGLGWVKSFSFRSGEK